MKKFRIYVDMDDTICEYTPAYIHQRSIEPTVKYPQSVPGFLAGLEPIMGAKEALQILKDWGHDVWILTKPSYLNLHCYSEKADWIYRHYGSEWVKKLILCPDKGLLKGDILIDDILWPAFEGAQIQYGHGEYQCWADVLYMVQQLTLWKLNNP